MYLCEADARGHAVDFALTPFDRERDGRIEEVVEIECIVGELPEVAGVDEDVFADALLHSRVVLIARAGAQRLFAESPEDIACQSTLPCVAGNQQILVVGCFVELRIRKPEHSVGRLNKV